MARPTLNLGLHDRADSLLHLAQATLITAPEDSLPLAAAIESLGRLDEAEGRFPGAADHFGRVLGVRRRHLGPHHLGR